MSFLGEQRRRERHVSARAVADQSHPATVEVEFRIVLGHPFHGGVNLIDRLRIFRFGRRRVVDENRCDFRFDDQIAYQPPVRGVVAEHPSASVDEDEVGKPPSAAVRPHQMQCQRVTVGHDFALPLVDARQVDFYGCLHVGEYFARFGHRQRFHRTTAGIEHAEILPGTDTQMFVVQIILRLVFHIVNFFN